MKTLFILYLVIILSNVNAENNNILLNRNSIKQSPTNNNIRNRNKDNNEKKHYSINIISVKNGKNTSDEHNFIIVEIKNKENNKKNIKQINNSKYKKDNKNECNKKNNTQMNDKQYNKDDKNDNSKNNNKNNHNKNNSIESKILCAIDISELDLNSYPILKFFMKNDKIEIFQSDKYYLQRLEEVINSFKNLNNNINKYKSDYESNFRLVFSKIFDDIILKVIRTYRFIFNNIEDKLYEFYNKYRNKLQYSEYSNNNKLLDKVYNEFKKIIL